MGEAGHPNVTSALDLLEDEGWFYIVMPFLPGGDLYNCVERNGAFHEPECFHFCKQVTDGLRGLHSLGVAHNDMSLENTMLDSRDRAVIIGALLSLSLSLSLSRSGLPPPRSPLPSADFGMCIRCLRVASPPGQAAKAAPTAVADGWPCTVGKLLYMSPETYSALEVRRRCCCFAPPASCASYDCDCSSLLRLLLLLLLLLPNSTHELAILSGEPGRLF
jgi:serine/threonine protein kinase